MNIDKLFYYLKNNIDAPYIHRHNFARYDSIMYCDKSARRQKNYDTPAVKMKKLFASQAKDRAKRKNVYFNTLIAKPTYSSATLLRQIKVRRRSSALIRLKRRNNNKKFKYVPLKLGPQKYKIIFRYITYVDNGIFASNYNNETIFTVTSNTLKITVDGVDIHNGMYLDDDEIFNISLNSKIKHIEILYNKNLNRYKKLLNSRKPAIYNINLNEFEKMR